MTRVTSYKKALIAAVAVIGLSACGDSSTQSITATTAADNTTSSTVAQSTSTVPVTSPPVSTPISGETAYLTNVRVAGQGAQDRVTFEFEGTETPGYSVSYVDSIPTGEEGSALNLEGTQKVEIRFSSASMVKLTGGMTRTYTGESRIVPSDTSLVAEVAPASSFEDVLIWGAGLRSPQPFAVSTLTNPTRVVIDFG